MTTNLEYILETVDEFCKKSYENKFKQFSLLENERLEENKRFDEQERKIKALIKKISLTMKLMKKNPHIQISYKKTPIECDTLDKKIGFHNEMYTYFLKKLKECK